MKKKFVVFCLLTSGLVTEVLDASWAYPGASKDAIFGFHWPWWLFTISAIAYALWIFEYLTARTRA